VGLAGWEIHDMADTPTTTADAPETPNEWSTEFLRQPGRFTTVLAIGVAALLIAATGMAGYRLGSDSAVRGLPDEFANVELLFDAVGNDAVDSPDPDALVTGAITGLLGTLEDPYAVYYDPERYSALTADLDGEFVGIGITIEERTDGIYVIGVVPESPAEEAGVMVGERITSVDGVSAIDGATSRDVVDMIAGEEGGMVTVGFDMGEDGPRELTLVRRVLNLPDVRSRVLDSGHAYARISQFSRQVDTQLQEQVEALVAAEDVNGLVLDLRGNPGGLLSEAVEVVSLFVEEGLVVRVDSRDTSVEREVTGDAPLADIPLVVLVDGNSASASEIVAGALQDLGRAEVVGTQTFGKGTVQTIRDLDLGAGVKFTTAEYFTPSGDSIEGVGVTPDVATDDDPEAQLAAADDILTQLIAESPGF
jgi:carboxyl-terminal processing protease